MACPGLRLRRKQRTGRRQSRPAGRRAGGQTRALTSQGPCNRGSNSTATNSHPGPLSEPPPPTHPIKLRSMLHRSCSVPSLQTSMQAWRFLGFSSLLMSLIMSLFLLPPPFSLSTYVPSTLPKAMSCSRTALSCSSSQRISGRRKEAGTVWQVGGLTHRTP